MADVRGALYFVAHENLSVDEREAYTRRAEAKFRLFLDWQYEQSMPGGNVETTSRWILRRGSRWRR